MRVAYISDVIYPFIKGGAEKRIYELSKRLADRGHEVHIFGIKWWKGARVSETDEGVMLHGVCNPIPLYVKGRRSIKEAAYFGFNLTSHLLNNHFDVIDCNEFPYIPYYIARTATIKKGSTLIATIHEVWGDYWYEYLGPIGAIGKIIEKGMIRSADRLIAVSNQTKNDLISAGASLGKISVIPNGINYSMIQKIPPSQENFDLIFVGRLIKERNIGVLLKSISFLKKTFPDINVGVIGDGPEKPLLERLTKKLDIEKNVIFYGFLEKFSRVISIMKSSKVFVHPSTREGGSSIVSLEANACGLPVVAVTHRLGISGELIRSGFNGFFIKELSPELMAEQVTLVLENEQLMREMRENAVEFASQYDWEKITDLVEKIYMNF